MSKLEVNEISKTPTGNEITIDSKLYLNESLKIKSLTAQQIAAYENPEVGMMVFDSNAGSIVIYNGSLWVDVGGTAHTLAFSQINVQGQDTLNAASQTDQLELIAGDNMEIITDANNDTVEIRFTGLDLSSIAQNIIPAGNELYDLGSTTAKWKDLYLSGNSITLGGQEISSGAGYVTFSGSFNIDNIVEKTLDAGVTIEGAKIEDGDVAVESLSEATVGNNIALNNNLVLAAGTTIDFTNGSATGLAGGGGGGANVNLLINGDFQVWQRALTTTTEVRDYHTVDRWTTGPNSVGSENYVNSKIVQTTHTIGQTDVPNNPKYYATWSKASGSGIAGMEQRIEGVETGSGQQVTLSFYARHLGGTRTLKAYARQSFGTTGSPSTAVNTLINSFSITNTWAKYTATVSLPSISGKQMGSFAADQTVGDYLAIRFQDDNGSAFSYEISQVKFELGGSATAHQPKTYQETFYDCLRYFQKLGHGEDSTNTTSNEKDVIVGLGFYTSSSVFDGTIIYKGPMRGIPTLQFTQGSSYWMLRRGVNRDYINTLGQNLRVTNYALGQGVWNVDHSSGPAGASLQITAAVNAARMWAYSEL